MKRVSIIISVSILIILSISISVLVFWFDWPGSFVFSEFRFIDNAQEEEMLSIAETFNFSQLSTQDVVFISQIRLDNYRTSHQNFNPFLNFGRVAIEYRANITWHSNLNLTINTESLPQIFNSPIMVEENETILFPYENFNIVGRWLLEIWNGSSYVIIEQNYNTTYTGVYLISMRIQTVSEAITTEYQIMIIDNLERVICVFWISTLHAYL